MLACESLYEDYGQPNIIAYCCEERLLKVPRLRSKDPRGMKALSVLLENKFSNVRRCYNLIIMLLRAKDNNIQSFAYIWLHKGNQIEFLKHPKIKRLDGGLEPPISGLPVYCSTT